LSCVTHISGREWHDKVLSYIQYINQLVLLLMSHLCSVYVTAFSCSTHGDCESRNTEQNMKITNGLEVLSCDQQMHMVLNTATSYRIREVLTVVETITCR